MDQLSYALGLGIGHQLLQMNAEGLNIDDFAQAIKDVMTGGELKMKEAEAQQMVQQFLPSKRPCNRLQMPRKARQQRPKASSFWPRMQRKRG